MKKIGITGGIGSGKTTVSKILSALGYPVYYADERGRWLTHHNSKVISSIKALFGESIYKDNILDKKKVANLVFSDKNLLQKLNAIVHPAVEQDFKDFCASSQKPILFKEAAIMFESGAYKSLDKVICVTAPKPIRLKRVINRDKTKKEQVLARMSHQMAEKNRIELSDFVIINDGKHFVVPQLLQIIQEINNA